MFYVAQCHLHQRFGTMNFAAALWLGEAHDARTSWSQASRGHAMARVVLPLSPRRLLFNLWHEIELTSSRTIDTARPLSLLHNATGARGLWLGSSASWCMQKVRSSERLVNAGTHENHLPAAHVNTPHRRQHTTVNMSFLKTKETRKDHALSPGTQIDHTSTDVA